LLILSCAFTRKETILLTRKPIDLNLKEPDPPFTALTLLPMSCIASFVDLAQRLGARLLSDIEARDGAHLKPAYLTKAAAARLKAGLRAVEAYLRRVLLCLALEMEPALTPDQSEYVKYARGPSPVRTAARFRILDRFAAFPEGGIERARSHTSSLFRKQPVPAAPLLLRLSALKTLLAAPEARARRLALYLARYRPGPLLPPGFGRSCVKRRYGTEISAHHDGLGEAITRASWSRPEPLGPRPRAGPRVRCLWDAVHI